MTGVVIGAAILAVCCVVVVCVAIFCDDEVFPR